MNILYTNDKHTVFPKHFLDRCWWEQNKQNHLLYRHWLRRQTTKMNECIFSFLFLLTKWIRSIIIQLNHTWCFWIQIQIPNNIWIWVDLSFLILKKKKKIVQTFLCISWCSLSFRCYMTENRQPHCYWNSVQFSMMNVDNNNTNTLVIDIVCIACYLPFEPFHQFCFRRHNHSSIWLWHTVVSCNYNCILIRSCVKN